MRLLIQTNKKPEVILEPSPSSSHIAGLLRKVSEKKTLINTQKEDVQRYNNRIAELLRKMSEAQNLYEVSTKKLETDYLIEQEVYEKKKQELLQTIKALEIQRDTALDPIEKEKNKVFQLKEEVESKQVELLSLLKELESKRLAIELLTKENTTLLTDLRKQRAELSQVISEATRKRLESDEVLKAHHSYIERTTTEILEQQKVLEVKEAELMKREIIVATTDTYFKTREEELEKKIKLHNSREARLKIAYDKLRNNYGYNL